MTTSVKTCFKCGEEKPRSEFYKHSQMGDGLLGKCKECTKIDTRRNRQENLDRYREYDRGRGNRQTRQDLRDYREKNPAKYKAHQLISYQVRVGLIKKPSCCVDCGLEARLHGHHDDYAKPLEVRWLCPACHHQWHAKHGEAKNAA